MLKKLFHPFNHRLIKAGLALAIALPLCAGAHAQGIRAAVEEEHQHATVKPLVVVTDLAFLPFEFKEGDKYVGFDIDLLDAITEKMGVKYTLFPMDFDNIFPQITSAKADLAIAGISITEERERSMDFSNPYFQSTLSLVASAQDPKVKSFAQLNAHTVAVKRGTIASRYVSNNYPKATLHPFFNTDAAFPYLEVAAGRIDALVQDTPNVLYFVNNKGNGLVQVVDTATGDDAFYAIAFPKGSPLQAQVNQALKEVIKSGQYVEIYKKWFGVAPDPQNNPILSQ